MSTVSSRIASHPLGQEPLARRIGMYLGPTLFVLVMLLPFPTLPAADGGTVEATLQVRATMGLALWMAAWWMTEALPLAGTALLPLVVMPTMGVATAQTTASAYFDDIIALFLGGFCLALAMEKSGLHRRVAARVMGVFGDRPRMMVLGFLVTAALLSMWISNTATALMLLPVALTIVARAGGVGKPGDGEGAGAQPAAGAATSTATSLPASPPAAATPADGQDAAGDDGAAARAGAAALAGACLLAIAYGASIGGIGTLIGTPPNAILYGFYNQHYAAQIADGTMAELTFARWMLIGVPTVVILLPLTWLVLTRVSFRVPSRLAAWLTATPAPVAGRGTPWSFSERAVAGVFLLTAGLWLTRAPVAVGDWTVPLTGWGAFRPFAMVTDGTIAVVAALLLFTLPSRSGDAGGRLLDWATAGARLPWGALLLFGGGLALATGFVSSGLSDYLAGAFGALGGIPPWAIIGGVLIGMVLLTEMASNTAATNMLLPVLAATAVAVGMDPLPLMVAGVLGASCAYMLPVATPPNTVVYASGHFTIGMMVRCGIWMNVLAIVVIALVLWLLGPLVIPS